MSVQALESVLYWHQAHSFVRGNWNNSEVTSPMILQKCCHDLDLLLWLSGKRCKRVSSFGALTLFKKERAPKGAALDVYKRQIVDSAIAQYFADFRYCIDIFADQLLGLIDFQLCKHLYNRIICAGLEGFLS